ncbi:MAG: Uncharacterized protein AWT59_3224 [Candidatus Gallionella acididurans]|uniref:Conjugal transfer protein TraN n=1 Tax=Candidatus Gallionella acididurans TaxID=1796491 RepID=A0A139BNS0_9PROT|nr:MAG: Uncharacterized protein AWT59_3224 [Candidatus Gallionella acididurans]
MKNKYGVLGVALLCCHAASIHAATPADQAFLDGQAAAAAGSAAGVAATAGASFNATMNSFNPTYYSGTSTATESALFQGGNGDTKTAGSEKISACQSGAANPDAFNQQNCNAINFMAKNPSTRPRFTLNPNDPMILKSRGIEANASTLAANSLPNTNTTGFSACSTTTVTAPASSITEVCNHFTTTAAGSCTVGRNVVVNVNTSYQCNQTNNAFSTQTCTRQANAVVTPTYFCSISGSATGLGSQERAVTKDVYSSALRRWVKTTTTEIVPGPFDVVFGCDQGMVAMVTLTIAASAQCHWGVCNSDYPPMKLDFIPGQDAGPVSMAMARTYDGTLWDEATVSYNGATNTVTVTQGRLTVSAVPSGTAGYQNVITSSWVDGCATQEAAAL